MAKEIKKVAVHDPFSFYTKIALFSTVDKRLEQTGACWRLPRVNKIATLCATLYYAKEGGQHGKATTKKVVRKLKNCFPKFYQKTPLDSNHKSNNINCLEFVSWDEKEMNQKRIDWLQQFDDMKFHPRGVIAIDDVLLEKSGNLNRR